MTSEKHKVGNSIVLLSSQPNHYSVLIFRNKINDQNGKQMSSFKIWMLSYYCSPTQMFAKTQLAFLPLSFWLIHTNFPQWKILLRYVNIIFCCWSPYSICTMQPIFFIWQILLQAEIACWDMTIIWFLKIERKADILLKTTFAYFSSFFVLYFMLSTFLLKILALNKQ